MTPVGDAGGRPARRTAATVLMIILVVAVIAESGAIALLVSSKSSTSTSLSASTSSILSTTSTTSSTSTSGGITVVPAGTWAPTASMLVATAFSGVVALPDGEILVAGGFQGAVTPAVVATSQIYNPSTGSWSATGSMHVPRAGFQALLLKDGDVLVAGGEIAQNDVTNTAEIYNPGTGTWTMTGNMTYPRLNYQAVLLNDGRVFVEGGSLANGSSVAEIYNPATGIWTLTPPQPFPREEALAVRLPDGDVLVAGGSTSTTTTTLSELYNPSTNAWTRTGSLNEARASGGGALLNDGDVLFAGGQAIYNQSTPSIQFLYTSELFNATTSRWTLTGDMSAARGSIADATVLLNNGDVLVPGGSFQPETGQASSDIYYPAQGVFGPAGNMSVPRGEGEMAATLPDGDVLVFGGLESHDCSYCGAIVFRGEDVAIASADIYTPAPATG